MSEATIEYKNSPNESTAYAVSEGQKTKVQLVATPAGDLELADNPNVDTGYLVIDGEKHKCALVAEVAGELKLPTSATDDTGYVTTQDGRQHKVKLVANVIGGGTQINNQDINVTQNGIYQAEEGYTGLGTVAVNVPSSGGSATRFGASIDSFLGNVDAEGTLQKTDTFVLNLAGLKKISLSATLAYAFAYRNCTKVIANDFIYAASGAFHFTFYGCSKLEEALFESLEEITEASSFSNAFAACTNLKTLKFSNLRTVSGPYACQKLLYLNRMLLNVEEIFPVLEEISGEYVFDSFLDYSAYTGASKPIIFPSVKKITGYTSQYSSTFGSSYYSGHIWHFPSATEFTKYIWSIPSSSPGEIHFAAANQAAIEACEGYDYKWGFAGATIYFDL